MVPRSAVSLNWSNGDFLTGLGPGLDISAKLLLLSFGRNLDSEPLEFGAKTGPR